MSQHEDDASNLCELCGVSFDVHEQLSPNCKANFPDDYLEEAAEMDRNNKL